MSNPAFSQFLRRWARKGSRPKAAAPARTAKLRVEEVESRVVPATLPAPLAGTAQQIVGGAFNSLSFVQPSAAVDPLDSRNLVMVTNNGTYMIAYASSDAGQTWSPFFDTNAQSNVPPPPNAPPPPTGRIRAVRLQDPAIDPANRTRFERAYTNTTSASAAFARDGSVYLTAIERNAANTSGAVVVYAFDFNDGFPTIRDLDDQDINDGPFNTNAEVLYRWLNTGTDLNAAANVTVAVNNNLPTFTDPESGQTASDPTAGRGVYVAFNTVTSLSEFNASRFRVRNPSAIQVVGSTDGGRSFTTPVTANSAAYLFANEGACHPRISFTPADLNPETDVNAGQITFAWQTTGGRTDANDPILPEAVTETSTLSPGVASSGRVRFDLNAPIRDATPSPGAGFPDGAATTTIPIDVQLPDLGNLDPGSAITDLNFGVAIVHPNPSTIRARLVSPLGTSVTLFQNWTDGFGQTPQGGPEFGVLDGSNSGIGVRTFSTNPYRFTTIGTTFDDEAPRAINDRTNADPWAYNVQTDSVFGDLLADLYTVIDQGTGLPRAATAEELRGEWQLVITDVRSNGTNPPPAFVVYSEFQVTAELSNDGIGTDRVVPSAGAAITDNLDIDFIGNPNILEGTGISPPNERPPVSPAVGLAGGVSIAYDASLGTFSPHGGRLYLAYTAPTYDGPTGRILVDSNVYLRFSDDGGVNWSDPVRVSDDNALDNFTEGRRWQFQPTVAVDNVTGTVVVMWLDARNDASNGRLSTYIATSIDGGRTFSPRLQTFDPSTYSGYDNQVPSNQAFLNNPKQAVDAVTGQVVTLEPVPSNYTTRNVDANGNFAAPNGPGLRQSLIAVDGQIFPFWAGNNNAAGTQIFIGRHTVAANLPNAGDNVPVRIAAGPRVVRGDQGPVIAEGTAGGPIGPYNNVFAADGTRLLTGFVVEFDRPVAVDSFTTADVEVRYRSPSTPLSVTETRLPLARVVPLNSRVIGGFTNFPVATQFFVEFQTPQGAVGTYSYAVGPDIRDRIRTVQTDRAGVVVGAVDLGNEMDQDADGIRNETNGSESQPDDRFAAPRPATGGPFTLPFAADSLPIIVPGPYVVGSEAERPAGQADTLDNLVLNSGTNALIVTFDRDIVPSSFTRRNIRRLTGPAGDIAGTDPADPTSVFTVTPVAVNPNTGGARSFRITFPRQVLSGGYTFEFGPNPVDNNPATNTIRAVDQPRLVTELAAGTNVVVVTFDRPITRAVTAADILRITGPSGPVGGPFTITRVGGNDRQFAITLPVDPARPAGQYVVEFNDNPGQTGNEPLRVPAAATDTAANRNPLPLIDTNHNAGLEQLRGGVPEPGTGELLQTRQYSSPGNQAIAIPANGTAEISLNIGDDFLVRQDTTNPDLSLRRSIRVALTATFPNVPDLRGELIAPDGSTVLLFDRPGTQGDPNQTGFATTIFDDAAQTPITAARPPFATANAAFRPQLPLGRLAAPPTGPVSSRGTWRVRLTNTGTRTGTIQAFSLTLPFARSGTGLGEAVADRFSDGFRIFTQDPSNPLSRQQWTPVGPASQNTQANSSGLNTGRVSAISVDPSDPSGNTVYVGGASGGVWKTTNFLTTRAGGPDWVPLTDLAATNGLNIGSIAVFGRNGDTNQSVILAATGEGDTLGEVRQGGGVTTVESAGVGFLLSEDGGKTWRVLDSTRNANAAGAILPISSSDRDRRFVGTVGFKVAIDPTPAPNGQLIFYAALSDNPFTPAAQQTGGIYRSNDTGRTWTLVRAGQATDVTLAAGSAPTFFNPADPNLSKNLQIMYAAFRGEGVFLSQQAPDAAATGGPGALIRVDGGGQNPLFRDANFAPTAQIPIATFGVAANRTPGGNKGRITLAVPALTGEIVQNVAYQGWVYAVVAGAGVDAEGGPIDGLYMSKDFGRNWTRVRMNRYSITAASGAFAGAYGTNDVSAPQYDPFGVNGNFAGNFAQSIAVDPLNPNIVYLGGSNQTTVSPLSGFLRVDVTKLEDSQAAVAYNNSLPNTLPDGSGGTAGPSLQFTRDTGSVVIGPEDTPPYAGPGGRYGIVVLDSFGRIVRDYRTVNTGFLNVFRDPNDPFTTNATVNFRNIDSVAGRPNGFQNRGYGATIQHIDAQNETNVHEIVTIVDPVTGKTRLLTGDDQGIASVVATADGATEVLANAAGETVAAGTVGFAVAPNKRRNGDLQLGQFYYGASQPSQLAADITGVRRLFYAMSDNNGYPTSPNSILQDGNTRGYTYTDPARSYTFGEPSVGSSGTGVATDQTGSGTVYEFRWPGLGGDGTNFFRVIPAGTYQDGRGRNDGFSRTSGLLQDRTATGGVADDPLGGNTGVSQGQWLPDAGSNFAVNPINGNGIIISANGNNQGVGRLFRTTNQGVNWFVIGETPQVAGAFAAPGQTGPSLDGTYSAALAFGAPLVGATATELDNFIYAGTNGGRIFVTRTGAGPWLNISAPTGGALGQDGALDGSAVQQIVTNPRRGSTDLFAVTLEGVYYKADAFDTATGWVNITGNLFGLQKPTLPNATNPTDNTPTLKYLTTIAADWRFATPVDPTDPQSPTFPVLYVGGEGGVFRSLDFGATWNYFPAATQYTEVATGTTFNIPAGGYLPNAHVTDLDLVLGDINPANGLPRQSESGGPNLLLATTFGRGQFAIRLDPNLPANSFVSGPRVTQLVNPNPVNGPSDRFEVVFDSPVDPTTFTAADVQITGPNGAIPVTRVVPLDSATLPTRFRIEFQQQADPRISVSVLIGANPSTTATLRDRPLITSLGGFVMNQNANLQNGEPLVDQYRTTIVLNAPTNNRLVVVSAPPTATAGIPVTVTVEARDANDLPQTGLNGRLDLTPGPGTGRFTPNQVQFVNGRATFEVTFERVGDQTVRVALGGANAGSANPTAFTVNVSAAATARFEVTPPATVITIGVNNPTVVYTVTARDQFGNPTTYSAPASVVVTGAGGQLSQPTIPITNGTGSFTGTFVTQGTSTVTVSSADPTQPGTTITGEATVSVNPGAATRIIVTPRAGGPYIIGTPVTFDLLAVDATGNLAAFNAPVSVTVGDQEAVILPQNPAFSNGTATVQITFQTPGTYTVDAAADGLTGVSGPLTVLGSTPKPPPTSLLPGVTAVGTDDAGSPVVRVFNPDGSGKTEFLPFGPGFNNEVDPAGLGFTGGNRVAVGDVTGDGVPDYVAGTGPTITAFVQVVDGATNQAIQNIQPFEDFKGGVFVAVGDVTGDGVADIVVTPDLSGGPRVSVYRGGDFRRVSNFFGIADPAFRGGARAGVGDLNGDGFAEVVVSAGFGGGPRISVFDGAALAQGRQVNPVGDFFIFEPELRNGAYVAVGDVDGDGFADIVAGAGPDGGPRVRVINGRLLLTQGVEAALAPGAEVANFFGGDESNRGGVRVAVKNLDGDLKADIVTGAGTGGGATVTAYTGASLLAGDPEVVFTFEALDGYAGGVFVG